MNSANEKTKFYFFWLFLLVVVLIDRWNLLQQFTFCYVDDDQSIMWFAAKEFAAGHFHEPCFYGQPYGTQFESLCAVPLIWCGVSYAVALTVTMSFITLFPYLLFSWLLLRKEQYMQALLVLSVLLFLPVEFGMITAISRGVLTGLFFAAIGLVVLYKKFRLQFVVFGFFSVLGLFANPSCILLLFPAGIWLFTEHFRDRKFYLHTLAGAVPAALVWAGSLWFYKVHPEYVVHGNYSMDFSLKILKPYEWDKFFGYVTPVFWISGLLVFPLLIALAVTLIRQKKKVQGYALLAGFVLLLASLTSLKVHYGFPTVFLSWGRMYTAVPLLIAVFGSQVNFNARALRFAPVLLLAGVFFFVLKFTRVDDAVKREVHEKTEHGMFVSDIRVLQNLCDTITAVANENQVSLVIVGNKPEKHLLNYGCPCMNKHFPTALEPQLDRRTWLLDAEAEKINENILFTGFFAESLPAQLLAQPDIRIVSQDPLMVLLTHNTLPTDTLLHRVGLDVRPH